MKKILIPISFSEASANSVRHSISLFPDTNITLIHCYSPYAYNREFNFGTKSYDSGIREKLLTFYKEHAPVKARKIRVIATAGSISKTISEISKNYDLLVMSKRKLIEKGGYWFSDRVTYIASKGHCPALLLTIGDKDFDFKSCKNVWHIKRRDVETSIIQENLGLLNISPSTIEVKSIEKTKFKSSIWSTIYSYSRTKNKKLIDEISKTTNFENLDLIILVSHRKSTFQNFMKAEVIQIINHYDIPLLVFQA